MVIEYIVVYAYLIPFRPQNVTLYYAKNTIYNGNHGYSIKKRTSTEPIGKGILEEN